VYNHKVIMCKKKAIKNRNMQLQPHGITRLNILNQLIMINNNTILYVCIYQKLCKV